MPPKSQKFQAGDEVEIGGTSRDDLNGRVGTVDCFDETRDRYSVRLKAAGGNAATIVAFRAENVKPLGFRSTLGTMFDTKELRDNLKSLQVLPSVHPYPSHTL